MKLLQFVQVSSLACLLAACGASDESEQPDKATNRQGEQAFSANAESGLYALGGQVSGLRGEITLSAGKSTLTVKQLSSSGVERFVFPNGLAYGEAYNVAVVSQPAGQYCDVQNSAGVMPANDSDAIIIVCQTAAVTVGGTVTGLVGAVDVRLSTADGNEDLTVQQSNFEFSTRLAEGQSYRITVLTQPEAQTCATDESESAGTVTGEKPIVVNVTCGARTFPISGVVNGLTSTLALSLRTQTESSRQAGGQSEVPQEEIDVTGGSFAFSNTLEIGDSFEVTIARQPTDQICTIENAVGVASENGFLPLILNCQNLSSLPATLAGTISIMDNLISDSDLNDPGTSISDNSTFATAQPIPNYVNIQGFVTQSATGKAGDNFEFERDENDFFSVTLKQGQGLKLEILDFEGNDRQNTFEGDLDLYLFDAAFNLVAFSDGNTALETVVTPSDGQYYVNVFARTGASKYILSLLSNGVIATANHSVNFIPNEAIIRINNEVTSFATAQSMVGMQLRHQQDDRATLANFSNQTSLAAASNGSFTGSDNTTSRVMDELASLNADSYEKLATLKKIKALRQDTSMMYVEPNYLRQAKLVPNDEFYPLQWHYPAMNLPQAWDITTGFPGPGNNNVIVAVVDTGVFLNHVELVGQLVPGYDFISSAFNARDGNGIDPNPDDPGDSPNRGQSSWHGTHVAGTIAARSNNNIGVAGVSWGAKVMPLRVLGAQGGSAYDIMQAVRYAAGLSNDSGTVPAQRADVINLSLGGTAASAAEAELFERVHSLGIVVVAAAGNENSSAPSYPAAYSGVISVSALDVANRRAPYSNFGSSIDIAAPGGDVFVDRNNDGFADGVLSTLVDDAGGNRQSIIEFNNGTSMAAPHVAGMIALMKAVYPELNATSFDALLQNGLLTDEAGRPGRDDIFGYGRANAFKAVQVAQALANGTMQVPPLPSALLAQPSSLQLGTLNLAQINLSHSGDDPLQISSIMPSEPWIQVTEADTNDDGFGIYNVSIEREDLNAGAYSGFITFNSPGTNPITVNVSMTVGAINAPGKLGNIYTFLADPDTHAIVRQVEAIDNNDGTVSFTLSDVPSGYYKLLASTDVDNDLRSCDPGEACGIYLTNASNTVNGQDGQILLVNGSDLNDLNFALDIINNDAMMENNIPNVLRLAPED